MESCFRPLSIAPTAPTSHWAAQSIIVSRAAMPEPVCSYPEAEATHDEVVQDYGKFRTTLHLLLCQLGITLKVMKIGGYEIDLHKLYKEVTKQGGVDIVCSQKQWVAVCEPFCFPSTFTNKSHMIKNQYMASLFHYEQVYFHRRKFAKPMSSNIPRIPHAAAAPLPATPVTAVARAPVASAFASASIAAPMPPSAAAADRPSNSAASARPSQSGEIPPVPMSEPIKSGTAGGSGTLPEMSRTAIPSLSSCCSGPAPVSNLPAQGATVQLTPGTTFSGVIIFNFGKGFVLSLDFGNGLVVKGVMYAAADPPTTPQLQIPPVPFSKVPASVRGQMSESVSESQAPHNEQPSWGKSSTHGPLAWSGFSQGTPMPLTPRAVNSMTPYPDSPPSAGPCPTAGVFGYCSTAAPDIPSSKRLLSSAPQPFALGQDPYHGAAARPPSAAGLPPLAFGLPPLLAGLPPRGQTAPPRAAAGPSLMVQGAQLTLPGAATLPSAAQSPLFFLASSLTKEDVRAFDPDGPLAEATVKLASQIWATMTIAQRLPFISLAVTSREQGTALPLGLLQYDLSPPLPRTAACKHTTSYHPTQLPQSPITHDEGSPLQPEICHSMGSSSLGLQSSCSFHTASLQLGHKQGCGADVDALDTDDLYCTLSTEEHPNDHLGHSLAPNQCAKHQDKLQGPGGPNQLGASVYPSPSSSAACSIVAADGNWTRMANGAYQRSAHTHAMLQAPDSFSPTPATWHYQGDSFSADADADADVDSFFDLDMLSADVTGGENEFESFETGMVTVGSCKLTSATPTPSEAVHVHDPMAANTPDHAPNSAWALRHPAPKQGLVGTKRAAVEQASSSLDEECDV